MDGITDAMNTNLVKLREMVRDKKAWLTVVYGLQRAGHNWATEQQWHVKKCYHHVVISHKNNFKNCTDRLLIFIRPVGL